MPPRKNSYSGASIHPPVLLDAENRLPFYVWCARDPIRKIRRVYLWSSKRPRARAPTSPLELKSFKELHTHLNKENLWPVQDESTLTSSYQSVVSSSSQVSLYYQDIHVKGAALTNDAVIAIKAYEQEAKAVNEACIYVIVYEIRQGSVDDPLDATLAHLSRHQEVWALLSKNCTYGAPVCHPWVFALNMCTLCQGMKGVPMPPKGATLSYRELYAHILTFPTLHYWALDGGHNVLTDIEKQAVLDNVICQYAFVHKQVHHRPLTLRGSFPNEYTRNCVHKTDHVSLIPEPSKEKKAVLSAQDLGQIRVYGLAVHHLEDCWRKHV